jgi:hypothetical protein
MYKILTVTVLVSFSLFISSCSTKMENGVEDKTNITSVIIPNSTTPIPDSNKNQNMKNQEIVDLKIGDNTIQSIVHKGIATSPSYFNMHDNENTAVEATKTIIAKHGGYFVELKASGDRLIKFSIKGNSYTFDPNRIFTTVGIKKTLENYGNTSSEAEKEVSNFAGNLISKFFSNSEVIIAVHNNTDGQYSVKSYEVGQEFETDASKIYINPKEDIDDFFYVTTEKHFQMLKDKGFNVVLQNNINVTDDGSLSVYCGNKKITYVNVESEHGHLEEQVKMLEILKEVIKK